MNAAVQKTVALTYMSCTPTTGSLRNTMGLPAPLQMLTTYEQKTSVSIELCVFSCTVHSYEIWTHASNGSSKSASGVA